MHDVTLESLAIFTLFESKSLRKYHFYSMDKTQYFTNMKYVFSFISRKFPYTETIPSVGKFKSSSEAACAPTVTGSFEGFIQI